MACGIVAFIMIVVVVLPELPNYKPRTAWKTDRFRPDSKGKAKFWLKALAVYASLVLSLTNYKFIFMKNHSIRQSKDLYMCVILHLSSCLKRLQNNNWKSWRKIVTRSFEKCYAHHMHLN